MVQLLIAVIYISFISLGLPDGLLGSAWPSMYGELGVPVSYMGTISMIIAGGTIVSALMSELLIRKLGTGLVTALSVATTAAALFGFSVSGSFIQLCVWAVPYGLGAGSVDAALNNFVAVNYSSRHMSWLHCFWGVGCSIGPYIMGAFLTNGMSWKNGYFAVFALQIVLTAILFISLPLWKKKAGMVRGEAPAAKSSVGIRKALSIRGVKTVMLTFMCYCSLESTVGLWAASYMVFGKGVSPEEAAGLGSLFYIGITAGRFINGFLTAKFSDETLVRAGQVIIGCGTLIMLIPSFGTAVAGLLLIGLGCAPIYPCIIHSTPAHFGEEASQAIIGLQMASAYTGTTLFPPFFGILSDALGIRIFPIVSVIVLVAMAVFAEILNRVCPIPNKK